MHLLARKPALELLVRDMSRPKPILWLFATYLVQNYLVFATDAFWSEFEQNPISWIFAKLFRFLPCIGFLARDMSRSNPFCGFLQQFSFTTQRLQQISAKHIHENKERNLISIKMRIHIDVEYKIRNHWLANFCPRQLCKHQMDIKRKENH